MTTAMIVSSCYDDMIEAALLGVTNQHTERAYRRWITEYLRYHDQQGKPPITRTEIQGFMSSLISAGKSPQSANQSLSAIKRLAEVLVDYQLIDETTAARIERTKGMKVLGRKTGSWLTERQAADLVNNPDDSLRGLRDRAVLAVAYGCGLRRTEIATLRFENLQYIAPEDKWVFQVRGKHNRTREIVLGRSVKVHLDRWIAAAELEAGYIFPAMDKNTEELYDQPMHPNTVYKIVKRNAEHLGLNAAPHDLRRSFALNSWKNGEGAHIVQIQKNLGHQSLATTEGYMNVGYDYKGAPSNFLEF